MENDAKLLIVQALESKKQIEVLREENRKENDAYTEERNRLTYEEYRDKIRALENERDHKIAELERERKTKNDANTEQTNKLYIAEAKVQKILGFLELQTRSLEIEDSDIHNREKYIESLGYFFNDDYLKIKLFIAENDKPKNKYSLIAFGKCHFDKEQLELPYSYGLPTYTSSSYSLEAILKEAPSIQELKTWLEKQNQSTKVDKKLFMDKLIEYAKVKREYLAIKEKYTVKDFTELLTWICDKCGNFYTIWDSSRSDYKCYRCENMMHLVIKETALVLVKEA